MATNKGKHSEGFWMDRRKFLTLSAVGAAGFVSVRPRLTSAQLIMGHKRTAGLSKFTEQLPVPPVLPVTGGIVDLEMREAIHSFHSSLPPTRTWGYGGATYLGPTIEARRGLPFTLKAKNRLGSHPLDYAIDTELHGAHGMDATMPRASVHLHGGNARPDSDGGPEDTFLPGADYHYFYNNNQEAATLWYHDHALGITRLNVFAGLAGCYFLRDEFDTGDATNTIDVPFGAYEMPLVIQDRSFRSDGSLDYPVDEFRGPWVPEFFGDVAVVNGKAFPNCNVDRGLYRFRVINGSNARVYNLYFSNGHSMYQIGSDGGLLNAPVPLNRLILAPGERADLLVDFSSLAPGSRIVLKNSAPVPFPDGPRSRRRGGVPLSEIMQFTVGTGMGFPGGVPATLRAAPIVPLPQPFRVRYVSLVELMDMKADEPIMALLNNLSWDTTEIENPSVDTVEQWNIINTTGDAHPIHLHLVQFQILGRQKFRVGEYLQDVYPALDEETRGPHPVPPADAYAIGTMKLPDANERGWKDTVRANPGEITRIMVPFGAGAAPGVPFGNSHTGDYVWHCHILEHEDNEMMLKYRVS